MYRVLRRIPAIQAVTAPGWTASISGVACLVLFPLFGWHELLAFALVALSMTIAAIAMAWGNTRLHASIRADHHSDSPVVRASIGTKIPLHADLVNPTESSTARMHADLTIGERHTRFVIPRMRPGRSGTWTFQYHASARAKLRVGPLRIRKGDPWGLIRREHAVGNAITIIVHPHIVPLPLIARAQHRDLEGLRGERIVDDDLDFHGLREYTPGDDIRRAHWLSSAKTRMPMIRQYTATCLARTSLAFDTRNEAYASREEFELAVSALASIGVAYLHRHHPLTLHTANLHIQPDDPTMLLDAVSGMQPLDASDNRNGNTPTDAKSDTTAKSVGITDIRAAGASDTRSTNSNAGTRDAANACDDANARSISLTNLITMALRHSPRATSYWLITGSGIPPDRCSREAVALLGSTEYTMLRVALGAECRIRRHHRRTVATIGSLNDLPKLMGAIV